MDAIHTFTRIILDKIEEKRSFAESQAKDNALRAILAPEAQQDDARKDALRFANEKRIWEDAKAIVLFVYDHSERLLREKEKEGGGGLI
ncbi:MAG: hypothetical protein PHT95_03355 [Candidatus Omnitrophica bacterium]|jgi:hypothetical protein|nr:hypothetical protein [Candidatus Omnitrophota bacterium]